MNSIMSLFFYIFSFLLSISFYYLYNKHNKKIFLLLSFFIPMIIGGLRYNVGTDYMNYLKFYINNQKIDFGFNLFSIITRIIGNSKCLFFLYNFFTLLFIFLGFNNLKRNYRTFSYFLFLFLFYTTSFNAIRQMLAVSIVFYSYKYIIKSNPLKYILFIIFSSLFHNSSLLFLPVYPIINNNSKTIKYIAILILLILVYNYESLLSFLTNINLFQHYELYSKYTDRIAFNNYSFYFELIILFIILINRKRMVIANESNQKLIYIYIFGIIFMISGFINPYVKRISNYFLISSILLLPYIPTLSNSNKKKVFYYLLIIGYVITKFIITTFVLGQSNIIPYSF